MNDRESTAQKTGVYNQEMSKKANCDLKGKPPEALSPGNLELTGDLSAIVSFIHFVN